jgi:hypothetical protein
MFPGLRPPNGRIVIAAVMLVAPLLTSPFAAAQLSAYQPANLASESAEQSAASAQAPAPQKTPSQAEPAMAPGSTISKPPVSEPPSATRGAPSRPSALENETKAKLGATFQRLNPARIITDPKLERAAAAFPEFCHEWEAKLVERTRYNLQRIEWKLQHGYETGDYVSYSKILSCTCKQTPKGIPIGKLTYQEFDYLLTGTTIDEASHSTPRPLSITNTTEIFRWDQNQWIY